MNLESNDRNSCSFVIFGDVHGNLMAVTMLVSIAAREQLRPNAILCVGDFPPQFVEQTHSLLCKRQVNSLNQSLAEAFTKIARTVSKKVLLVPGNWDHPALRVSGAHNVDLLNPANSPETVGRGRYKVVGFGGSRSIGVGFPYEWSEGSTWKQIEVFAEGHKDWSRTIVLSHDVPAATKVDINNAGVHQGSQSIRRLVEQFQPLLLICGHIHEGSGIDILGPTVVLNAGQVLCQPLTSFSLSESSASLRAWREYQMFYVRVAPDGEIKIIRYTTEGPEIIKRVYCVRNGKMNSDFSAPNEESNTRLVL